MPYGFIYLIENDVNAKLYVGQTTDLHKRERIHLSANSDSPILRNAIKKHGREHFDLVLLEACKSLEELNSREIFWIDRLNTVSPGGYNLRYGGLGGKHSEATKRKISQTHLAKGSRPPSEKGAAAWKGQHHTREAKNKISKSHRGEKNPNFGKFGKDHPRFGVSQSEKQKEATRKSWTGRKHTKESIQKMRESHRKRRIV